MEKSTSEAVSDASGLVSMSPASSTSHAAAQSSLLSAGHQHHPFSLPQSLEFFRPPVGGKRPEDAGDSPPLSYPPVYNSSAMMHPVSFSVRQTSTTSPAPSSDTSSAAYDVFGSASSCSPPEGPFSTRQMSLPDLPNSAGIPTDMPQPLILDFIGRVGDTSSAIRQTDGGAMPDPRAINTDSMRRWPDPNGNDAMKCLPRGVYDREDELSSFRGGPGDSRMASRGGEDMEAAGSVGGSGRFGMGMGPYGGVERMAGDAFGHLCLGNGRPILAKPPLGYSTGNEGGGPSGGTFTTKITIDLDRLSPSSNPIGAILGHKGCHHAAMQRLSGSNREREWCARQLRAGRQAVGTHTHVVYLQQTK